MRIDVGDVGDAQLPPALNLTLGVGLVFNYDLLKFGFFASKSPSMASIMRGEAAKVESTPNVGVLQSPV